LSDRRAYWAGRFYPRSEKQLRAKVQALLSPLAEEESIALMLPHAGYSYSGALAGGAIGSSRVPSSVLLIGPKHRPGGAALALNRAGSWHSPLGRTPLNQDLAEALMELIPALKEDDEAHRQEHSLEVLLPLLQLKQPQLKILPILLGAWLSPEKCLSFGARIAELISRWPEPVLMVASSDMHHQAAADLAPGRSAQEVVQAKSARALERVEALDPRGLLECCRSEKISMCGAQASAVVIAAAKALGAQRAERLGVIDSQSVSGGDGEWVVGYAAYRFS